MSAHSLLLLDSSSSLADTLRNISNALFQVPVIITALVLTFVCALIAWIIAYVFLRPKEVCSMVCSIHFLLTIATIVLGLLGALGLIDHYFPGSLITGASVSLLVLAIPLFILVESFNYVVLSNKHARRHRDLRTPQDRNTRRGVVFLAPLALGVILLAVGIIVGTAVSTIAQVIVLLLVLWLLAIGAELLVLLLASRRRRRVEVLGDGAALNREELAAIWVSGFSSYRIGRGETVFTSETMTVEERETAWGTFTERVFVTEELILEEEGELDLIEVEEAETATYAVSGGGSAALALHGGHRNQRHPAQNRFFRRWGGALLLLLVAAVAVVAALVGAVAAAATVGIALAFLAPVLFLLIHRARRDSEMHFATATAQKISTVQYSAVAVQEAVVVAEPTQPTTPASRRTTGAQTAVPLHPARPVPVTPPLAEPEIPPKEEPEPPTLPSADAEVAGAAHENPDIAEDTIIGVGAAAAAGAILAGAAGAAHENPDIAEDTLLIGHTPVSEVSDRISITEFQHYLRGIHYPATREQLIAQARANNAPPNMIARLEVLEEGYTFVSVSEVMRGYAYHRYLRGVRYPATRDQLLAHARANNAPPKLISWLEGLEATVVFASLAEVLRSHTKHLEEKGEESADDATLLEAAPVATGAAAATDSAAADQVSASKGIRITEFQHYLHGVDYPATREQLIAQARANNAPPNMITRLEELDETHSFISVRDVMIGYAYHRYLRGATYPATRDQLLAHARANNAPKKLILWLETLSATVTFASLTEVVRSYATHHHDEEEIAEEAESGAGAATAAETPAAAAAPAVSSRIGIIEFQRYLHGVDYPATRAQLIEQARANNAPPNMIARLEELDETHSFINVRDVMIGYAYHRYLRGATYPATRDELLAHARANKAPGKLIGWLETLSETVTFASLTEVVRSYSTHHVEEDEEDEDDEKTVTIVPTSDEEEGLKGIGVREFAHYLRGIHYPATRDQLLTQARQNEAPANMIARLEGLPEHHRFTGMTDVMRGYGHHITDDETTQ
ncbi:MAG TPA: DUF2795 domain-containing protein [Ktedonobacterales bacterium]|nr:DUF2795 domain-containing protein [Ktedonobacterales bacterium]